MTTYITGAAFVMGFLAFMAGKPGKDKPLQEIIYIIGIVLFVFGLVTFLAEDNLITECSADYPENCQTHNKELP